MDGGIVQIDWAGLGRIIPEAIVLGIFIWYTLRSQRTAAEQIKQLSADWRSSIEQLVTDHRAASEKRDDVTLKTLELVASSLEAQSAKISVLTDRIVDLNSSLELGLFKSVLEDEDKNGSTNS